MERIRLLIFSFHFLLHCSVVIIQQNSGKVLRRQDNYKSAHIFSDMSSCWGFRQNFPEIFSSSKVFSQLASIIDGITIMKSPQLAFFG